MGDHINRYITQSLKYHNRGCKRHRFIKGVFLISKKVIRPIFDAAILRALKYEVYELEILNNICSLLVTTDNYTTPEPDIDYGFENRDNYLEGEWSEEPDLSKYEANYLRRNNDDV